MKMPPGPDQLRIPVVPIAGRFADKTVILKVDDLLYAFLGSKALSCVRAPWVGHYRYHNGTVYGRSRTFGLVRVRVPSLKRLRELLGAPFVQVEQGVLANVDAVAIVPPPRSAGGYVVGVLVDARPPEVPVVEELVASRAGHRMLMGRLAFFMASRPAGRPARRR